MISAVVFDLMGTLAVSTVIDEVGWIYHMVDRLAEYGLQTNVDQLKSALDDDEARPSETGHTPFEEHIYRVARSLGTELGWQDVVSIADSTCLRSESFLEVDPDAVSILEALEDKHTPLVTNYNHPPEIYRFLDTLGLRRFLDPVIISGEIGIWKPDPGIILAALDAIGVSPSEAVYVGDSRVDIQAALSAGVLPVLVSRHDGRADPFRPPEGDLESEFAGQIREGQVRVVHRLTDLLNLL